MSPVTPSTSRCETRAYLGGRCEEPGRGHRAPSGGGQTVPRAHRIEAYLEAIHQLYEDWLIKQSSFPVPAAVQVLAAERDPPKVMQQ
ncbi:thymidine kinase 2, mitochondrial isoform X2 [Trichomycterus rosablanca]|uniref:thymidine kinase 2, mitochondrial isoform X2 n=1 Tax=Trichomycterus rosablanca TaxID=2290929 RepID=UPI002F360009